MEILRKPPRARESAGLAANDASMIFPILGGALSLLFYVNQQKSLLDGYLANSEQAVLPEVVANIPLRFPDPDEGLYNFRMTMRKEKEAREQALVRLVRAIFEQGKGFAGSLQEVSAPAASAKSTWEWVKQYKIKSIFQDEVPAARYLPVACMLSVTDASGATKVFHGGLTSLVVEADKDLLRVAQAEDMAVRVYGTLRDTNWRNMGTGTPKYVYFMYTQDKNLLADVALLDKPIAEGGKKVAGTRVSSLALDLYKTPVGFSTNVYRRFRERGLSLGVNAAYPDSVRLVYDKGGQLVFLLRALKRVFPETIGYTPADCSGTRCLQVHGALPMALRFNDTMLKVRRVILTTDAGEFPSEDLDETAVVAKGVMLETNLGVIYQDTTGSEWKLRDAPTLQLQQTTRLDLVVFSENADISAVPENLQQGSYKFEDFDSRRYFYKSTLDQRRYNMLHADDPVMRVDSPETRRPEAGLRFEVNAYSGGSLAVLALFALFAWMKPSGMRAYRLGQLAALAGIAFALLSVFSFLSIRFGLFPWMQKNHDDVLFYASVALLAVSGLAVIASLRFNRTVPSGVYVMSLLLLMCIFLIRATPVEDSRQLTTHMRAWRSALIVVIFKSGLALALEALKMGGKAAATPIAPQVTSGLQFAEAGTGLVLFMVVVFYPFYRMLLSSDNVKCESRKVRLEWLQREIDAGRNVAMNREELGTLTDEGGCSGLSAGVAVVSGKLIGFAVVLGFFLYYISAPFLWTFARKVVPSRHPKVPMKVYENAPVYRLYHFANLAVSVGLLVLTASILLPLMQFVRTEGSTCDVVERNVTSFSETYGGDVDRIFYDTENKKQQIKGAVDSLGCISAEISAVLGVSAFLFILWMLSIVTPPLYSLTSPVPSVLELVFFLVFTGFVASVFFFMTEKENLRKSLEIDAARIVTQIVEVLVPP